MKGRAHSRMQLRRPHTLLGIVAILCVVSTVTAAPPVDYDRDVLPVLSDNCYKCHGPDQNARKVDLRLDTKDGAFRVKDGKAVIVAGKTASSELVRRITSHDPEEMMPPPKSQRKLTAAQIETLTRWVSE